jgi:hypothetical protein
MTTTSVKITITLTNDNVKEAVADWMNQQGAIGELAFWVPEDVIVGAEMQWRGYGTQESQVAVAKIEARK